MGAPYGDLGPATIIWDAGGAGDTDLGPHFGGIIFKDEVKYKEIREDGYGDQAVDAVFTGRITTITTKMTESTLVQLSKVIPSATVVAGVMTVVASVGTQMRALAKKVTIKRLVDGAISTTTTEWISLLLAYPVASPNWTFDPDGQRVTEVTFIGFPSKTTGSIGQTWKIGA
jgi:hypothetical protein